MAPSAFDRLKSLGRRALAALAPWCLALGWATAPGSAQALVLTFENLTCGDQYSNTQIANGYAGLNWSNVYCIDGQAAYGGNSGNKPVSGTNVAYNGFGNPAEFTITSPGGTKFNFKSVYLTGVWNDNLVVTIVAYRNGTAVSTTTHTLSATAPTWVALNLSQIDRVNMSSAGGTHHAYPGGGGTNFAMDNLDISYGVAPTDVTATAGNAQATVAFTPPSDVAQYPPTGYQATCTPQGSGTAVSANGAGSPIVVSGLTNGIPYNCTVTTLYSAGGSVPSAPAAVTPMTVPAAPTGVTATSAPGQATLAFIAPTDTGGSPITSYQATCTPQGGGTAVSANGTGSPIVVPGLTNGTTYNCTVSAVNAVGTSAASSPVAVTPQAAAVPTLSQWALLVLASLLGVTALRSRRAAPRG